MGSSEPKRRFPPPWRVEPREHGFDVEDANGFTLATVHCDDSFSAAKWRDASHLFLTRDEGRRIALGISRLPELLKREPAFECRYVSTSSNRYWSLSHPFHVALYDPYIRENYDKIIACCAMNKIPYEPTGERVSDGAWCTYQFAKKIDAIKFWDAFNGRWMLGDSFYYPERPSDLVKMEGLSGPFGAFI